MEWDDGPPDITLAQQQFVHALHAAVTSGVWKNPPNVGGLLLRYIETHPTPDWVPPELWGKPYYQKRLDMIVKTSTGPWSVKLRKSESPWIDTVENEIPINQAMETLADPGGLFWFPEHQEAS